MLEFKIGVARQVLIKTPAKLHVDDLRSPANAENGQPSRQRAVEQRPLKGIASPVHLDDFDGQAGETHSPETLAVAAEERAELARAMATLPERLRSVLQLYYHGDLSLKEIGLKLGVTESRVCQLHGEAVKMLRLQMAA